jgi:hypothetical protein
MQAKFLGFFIMLVCILNARAQDVVEPVAPSVLHFEQLDENADGQIEASRLYTSIVTENDTITVYDGLHNMQSTANWQEAVDFSDDSWVFDISSDAHAELVIVYSQEENTSIANLYTDINEFRGVEYHVDNGLLVIDESQYPVMSVRADGGWYLPDGRLNWNLDFEMDGTNLLPAYTSETTLSVYEESFLLDGNPDVSLQFRDDNLDGIPEYQLLRLLIPSSDELGPRTIVFGNSENHPPVQAANFIFWPFLYSSSADSYFDSKLVSTNFFDTPPVVLMDWELGQLAMPDLYGYPIEDGFMVKSFEYFNLGELNPTDFESNMDWYDLANDNDGFAELHIRNRYYAAFDRSGGNLPVPISDVRYSWNQFNNPDASWDYKLGLAGRIAVEGTVSFPEFSYTAIPHEALPNWVIEQNWDIATFVQHHDGLFRSLEGILDWPVLEHAVDGDYLTLPRYLAGQRVIDLPSVFEQAVRGENTADTADLRTGFRGEIAYHLGQALELYFSPIDNLLHLSNADMCYWDIDAIRRIRCENLGPDSYLDYWKYYENDVLISELYAAENHLISFQNGRLLIKEAHVEPAIFETQPPSDTLSWSKLQAQITSQPDPMQGLGDFEALLNRFAGEQIEFDNVGISQFRFTEEGFRLLIQLNPNSSITHTGIAIENLENLRAGQYVLEAIGNHLILSPLSEETILIETMQLYPETGLHIYDDAYMELVLQNPGSQDWTNLNLSFIARHGNQRREISNHAFGLLAGGSISFRLPWIPSRAGDFDLIVQVLHNEDILLEQSVTLSVAEPGMTSDVLLSLAGEHEFGGILLVVFIALISLIAAGLFFLIIETGREDASNEPDSDDR